MALPLNLAMTAAEISAFDNVSTDVAWMACHFSPYAQGITNIPSSLPPGAMLILNDRMPCQSHSADLVAQQMLDTFQRFGCESVLLDFQRPGNEEAAMMARTLIKALPCPVAVTEHYAAELDCPVFLSPAPLHVPLKEHLAPWHDREIWLEAALCQETITITEKGTTFAPQFPPDNLDGGFFEETLCCNYRTEVRDLEIRFTLFDTRESLDKKLELAQNLGVTRAVGLFQELRTR